jgi:hypothetical protein
MSDEHTPTSQDIDADRGWWQGDAGQHYRDLAHWLRGIAAKCRLPIRSGNCWTSPGATISEPTTSAGAVRPQDRRRPEWTLRQFLALLLFDVRCVHE